MIELDRIIAIGPVCVAAMVKRSLSSGSAHALWLHGTKRPVAVLIHLDNRTQAFDASGTQIATDDFERLYPGQLARFERLAPCQD